MLFFNFLKEYFLVSCIQCSGVIITLSFSLYISMEEDLWETIVPSSVQMIIKMVLFSSAVCESQSFKGPASDF